MTDTNIWEKIWFRKLKPQYKCFWFYIKDRCNHAGIWEVDLDTAEYFIGGNLVSNIINEVFQNHILQINETKWYLVDFIKFQYNCEINELNPESSVHKGVIKELEKYNITTLMKGLPNPYERTKDKDKDKDMDKEIKTVTKEYFLDLLPITLSQADIDSWCEWADYRTEIKKKLTKRSARKQIEFLLTQPKFKEVIDQSIKNQWQGLFEVKDGSTKKHKGNTGFQSKLAEEGRGNTGRKFNYITSRPGDFESGSEKPS